MPDENHFCVRHSGSGGSLRSTWNHLMTCIDGLADNNLTDETMLAASNMTSMTTRASGGNTSGTFSTISTVSKILSSITAAFSTNTFHLIKNFLLQNISAAGANDSQSVISSFACVSDVSLQLSN